ncbi:queuosine precursor transporter [Cyclobacteriaceae bacterium]|nr:queuosine precursor transporter [Cyclobacteriaceae bacterium]
MFISDHDDRINSRYYHRREYVFLGLTGIFLGSLTMLNILSLTKTVYFDLAGIPIEFVIGVLPYPITFLCTDLISEIYGKKRANAVVWVGVLLNAWVLFILWLGDILPAKEGDNHEVFEAIKGYTYSATFASMAAYLTAQFIDVKVFHLVKKLTKGKYLWLRNNSSTLISQLVDSIVVTTVVYFTSDAYAGKDLFVLIYSLYLVKMAIALLDTIPFYLLVNFFNRYLHIDTKKDY